MLIFVRKIVSRPIGQRIKLNTICVRKNNSKNDFVDAFFVAFDPFPSYAYTGKLRAIYPLSTKRIVPPHIARPDYADDPQGNLNL